MGKFTRLLISDKLDTFINIDGRLIPAAEANIPYDNRAFRYGYGLFETILVRNEKPELGSLHWQRLFNGMKQLQFNVPKLWSPASLEEQVVRTVRKNKYYQLCRVRLQVWGGNGGLYDAQSGTAGYMIECFPLDEQIIALNENGLTIGIATGLAKSADELSPFKSSNALIYAIAAQQAKAKKWNDALILNTSGRIIESTIANIFWVKDGHIYTPPITEGCVAGIMRQYLLDLLPTLGYKISEKELTVEAVSVADEIFITNSIRKLKWINNLLDKRYTNKVILSISKSLEQYPVPSM